MCVCVCVCVGNEVRFTPVLEESHAAASPASSSLSGCQGKQARPCKYRIALWWLRHGRRRIPPLRQPSWQSARCGGAAQIIQHHTQDVEAGFYWIPCQFTRHSNTHIHVHADEHLNQQHGFTNSLTYSKYCHKSTNIQEQIWKKLVSCSLYCVCFPFEQVPSIPHSVCLWVWEYAHSRKRMETPGTQAHIHCYTAKQSYHCILHDAIKAEPLQDRTCLPSGSLLIIYFLHCFSEPKTVNVTNMLLYVYTFLIFVVNK